MLTATIAMFVAIIVVPTPPFGLKTVTIRRGAVIRRHRRRLGRKVAGALEAQQQRLDPGLELAGVDRLEPRHRRPRPRGTDPLLDLVVWLTHRTGTGATAGVPRISALNSTADFGPPTTSRIIELVLGHVGERVLGFGGWP